ncbi:MAG: ExsB family transcriptional regulator, partial [Candidatus Hydrothermarchaeales archaeon]
MVVGLIEEIKADELDTEQFISSKIGEIQDVVGDGLAINALSGGVDSSTVTMLGHRALGERLLTYFVDHGLMREGEPQRVVDLFKSLGVKVELLDARDEFFGALIGVEDPEEKREAITSTFYRVVFGRLVRETGARYLMHGTILTDVDETVAGIKRQHNILSQIGIDTKKEFGYHVMEPRIQLRKEGVRRVAEAVGLPEEVYNRRPFLG